MMGWDKVEGKNWRGREDTVRLSIEGNTRTPAGVRVKIFIGRNVWKKLGWNLNTRVDAYWGTDKHKGSLRLEETPMGRFLLRNEGRKGSVCGSLNIGISQLPPGSPRQKHKRESVKFVALDKLLDLTLPGWFYSAYEKKHPNDTHRGRPLAHAARSPAEGALRHNGAQVTPE